MNQYLLIHKKLANQLNQAEELLFNEWINATPENLKEFQTLEQIWKKSSEIKLPQAVNTEKAFTKLSLKIQKPTQTDEVRRLRMKPSSLLRYAVAASVLIAICIGGIYFFKSEPQIQSFATSHREKKQIKLEDGTLVFLNSNSSLNIEDFSRSTERKLELKGEAYFEVAKDPQRKFIVRLASGSIEVLGTKFNVLSSSSLEEITVTEGHVRFTSKDSKSVDAIVNQKIEIKDSNLEVRDEQDFNEIAWHTNMLQFNNTELSEVCKDLSKYYNTNISLSKECLSKLRFTSPLDLSKGSNIIQSLSIICKTFNLQYSNNQVNTYIIDGNCE